MRLRIIVILLIMLTSSGCYRAVYKNVQGGRDSAREGHSKGSTPVLVDNSSESGWQHFFIYGLVPSEKIINASGICGGAEHIKSISTRRTFAEGLVTMFAGYYINIYSPYDGEVECDNDVRISR